MTSRDRSSQTGSDSLLLSMQLSTSEVVGMLVGADGFTD